MLSILVPGRSNTQGPSNTARVILRLKPWDERDIKREGLQGELQGRPSAIPGVRALYLLVSGAAAAPGGIEDELRRLEESHPEPNSSPAPS